jgi:hypothetical protein
LNRRSDSRRHSREISYMQEGECPTLAALLWKDLGKKRPLPHREVLQSRKRLAALPREEDPLLPQALVACRAAAVQVVPAPLRPLWRPLLKSSQRTSKSSSCCRGSLWPWTLLNLKNLFELD